MVNDSVKELGNKKDVIDKKSKHHLVNRKILPMEKGE